MVTHEARLAAKDQHGAVDEFHQEQFIVTCNEEDMAFSFSLLHGSAGAQSWKRLASKLLPTVSLTADSCPFFLVQTYFPLLALSATLCPRHSMSNIVLILLGTKARTGFIGRKVRTQRKSSSVKAVSYSHFCGSRLDLSVSHQSPVRSTIGPEHRPFAFLVNLHLEGLHVCLHILIG